MTILFACHHEFPPYSRGGGELTAKDLLTDLANYFGIQVWILAGSKSCTEEQKYKYEGLDVNRVPEEEFETQAHQMIESIQPNLIVTYGIRLTSKVLDIAHEHSIPVAFLIMEGRGVFEGLNGFDKPPEILVVLSDYLGNLIRDHFGYNYFKYPPKFEKLSESTLLSPASRFDFQTVGMVNPNRVKGGMMFDQLAGKFINNKFLATDGWSDVESAPKVNLKSPNIQVLNWQEDISSFYNSISVLLIPSLCPEGFGRVAREACLYGIPILASNRGALKESSCDAGILLNPVDLDFWIIALKKIISSYQFYLEVVQKTLKAPYDYMDQDEKIRLETIRAFQKFFI